MNSYPIGRKQYDSIFRKRTAENPCREKWRIKRELDEETISFSNGLMDGKYHRYRDGVLRETGAYDQGKRNGVFTEYYQDGKTVSKITPMKKGKIDGCVKPISKRSFGFGERIPGKCGKRL